MATIWKVLGLDSLEQRRGNICLNFANKSLKHPKYKNWFCPSEVEPVKVIYKTRATIPEPIILKPVPYRTDRYRDSPIPFLTNILNVNK